MGILKTIEKTIVRLNMAIMVVSLAVMIVLALLQVVLRNLFDLGFTWADIVIRNLVLWAGFSGAVVATSRGRHIAIWVLLKFVPKGGKRAAHILTSIITSVICLFLAWSSGRFVVFEAGSGSVLFGNVPLWVSELIIPATFCFLTYLFFVHSLEAPPPEEDGSL